MVIPLIEMAATVPFARVMTRAAEACPKSRVSKAALEGERVTLPAETAEGAKVALHNAMRTNGITDARKLRDKRFIDVPLGGAEAR